jgi:large subunit ribosomal protein L28
MSNYCQLTGARPRSGNSVSHSNVRTKRWFRPNLQRKRYFLPSEGRWVRLTLSARAIKIIDRQGIEGAVAQMRKRGERV